MSNLDKNKEENISIGTIHNSDITITNGVINISTGQTGELLVLGNTTTIPATSNGIYTIWYPIQVSYPLEYLKIHLSDKDEESTSPEVNDSDGCTCDSCKEFVPYAQAQNGKFNCYKCRSGL